ncbi:hypothetical protein [Pararcticibacter amylolyticus]|uniref:hypothetical protein n=1 Tax=Pararcticibacter amylolyticus TaxID=2173175 RepID=UPI0013050680|nr:hypothetical protein [Pararcticibacter amylolyticus]
MKKNININQIDNLTRNTDKQLMQMLMADLESMRGKKNQSSSTDARSKQAA